MSSDDQERLSIHVSGVVQGVGFRPFVYNLAVKNSLVGSVRNTSGGVDIEIQGKRPDVRRFVDAFESQLPPLAIINELVTQELEAKESPEDRFTIEASAVIPGQQKTVPADTAICADCRRELFDPHNRRFRYPFINCTNCGPRFTIIQGLPYDRPATTMAKFIMCQDCRREYEDPANRRFHAQPNACPDCGPALCFTGKQTDRSAACKIETSEEALREAHWRLKAGEIIAARGLGGFHLLCDACNEEAVRRLRRLKGRYAKPLAVMMPGLDAIRQFCRVNAEEESLLSSPAAPIVLLKRTGPRQVADSIAPGTSELGVMIPYTPLHYLLLSDFGGPVVATSGNRADEPIAIDNDEAVERLNDIADGFLLHNRPIESRYDDSVSRSFGGSVMMVRRSRGYAPLPLILPFSASTPVLACGAQLKNTFCLVEGNRAFVSQHIGDLDDLDALDHFNTSLEKFLQLFSITPQIVAHDMHPDYLSTAVANEFARAHDLQTVSVQHHHAHIVSCMVEHEIETPVIGVAFDGLGYGTDGTFWGGEFLISDWKSFERKAFFEPVPLPGGNTAVRQPWRMALSYLLQSPTKDVRALELLRSGISETVNEVTFNAVRKQIETRFNAPLTSSCGRLFDAVSALLGICTTALYEGQAAVELETMAAGSAGDGDVPAAADIYPYDFGLTGGQYVISPFGIVEAVAAERRQGFSRPEIAAKFHHTMADVVLRVCERLRKDTGIGDVCLSGGVFQNMLLLKESIQLLSSAGFNAVVQRRVPTNDGGVSLGQAVVALASLNAIGR